MAKYAVPGDILHDKSLEFYRGTMTKEQLAPIDERLEALIKTLAVNLLDSHAQRVLEYLVRIYEVHIYHKHTVLLAFLPYFETAIFLKAIQCLNLKDDQIFGFLHEFAYTGKSIDKATLVRCLARQNGLVFTKYSEFAFSLINSEISETSLEGASDGMHWKFFGTILVEVLRVDASHQLMFNVLPFISKAMRQGTVRDLRVSGLFAIGQVACRRSISAEYTKAFFQQVMQTVADSTSTFQFDEDLKLKGMTVILLIAQHQQHALPSLSQKDLETLLKLPRVAKLLKILSQQFDTSALAQLIVASVLASDLPVKECLHALESLLQDNLQTTFAVT